MAGFVFEFIQRVDQLARVADGTVVKRIGDELMVTLRTYRRQSMRGAVNVEEKEREYIGYFVEWEGTFESFTRDSSEICLRLQLRSPSSFADSYFLIILLLPLSNLEIVNALRKGLRLRARGVIHDIQLHIITLNYVDLEIVAERGGA